MALCNNYGFDLETVTVKCQCGCGTDIKIQVWPGTTKYPRKTCYYCDRKDGDMDGVIGQSLSEFVDTTAIFG